jgi:hypothetical protein
MDIPDGLPAFKEKDPDGNTSCLLEYNRAKSSWQNFLSELGN